MSREVVPRLGQLQQAASRDESESPALCEAVRGAVTGAFGAQITLLIHQEKLDAPKGAVLSSNAKSVWGTLAEVARQLLVAWEEHFRKLMPAGVEPLALITAVSRSKLMVAAMVPAGLVSSKAAKAPMELREAVMRAWPVMMAVMREVNPRDVSAEAELLKVAVSAFDPAHAAWG